MSSRTFLLLGASSGLGHGLSALLPEANDRVLLVSRSQPPTLARQDGIDRSWIGVDLAEVDSVVRIRDEIGNDPVHCMVFLAARWDAAQPNLLTAADVYNTFAVNLASFVAITLGIRGNLVAGDALVVAVGSTAALDKVNGAGVHPLPNAKPPACGLQSSR